MIYPHNFEKKIGFDQIRLLLKNKCLSTLGQERMDAMTFSNQFDQVNEQLDRVNEFLRILREASGFSTQFFFDVRPSLARVQVNGTYLEEQELFNLRRSLETIRDIVQFLRRSNPDEDNETIASPYPCLKKLTEDVRVFPDLIRRVNEILDPYGQIKDNASAELASIRRELGVTVNSISRALNSILRSAQNEGVVEKTVSPTMRDGRLVIPVAPSLKRRIKGIVHDESASGKTVFIEPAEVVEANNRVRELEGEERREIIRILTAFTDEVRPVVPDLLQSYEFLAEIDFIRAKALLAQQIKAVKPSFENRQVIDWISAVHPLLQLSLEKHGHHMVPLDIELNDKQRILIISGPNAGGKSVCLETVGLLQYMLQCGLLIPVRENSHAGLFEHLFIDIGDEQSIEDELSTYSGHLTNMKFMMRMCNERSLILIDEFGSGTEPQIGGAIAEAVLKRLCAKNTFGVITTHYQNLKHFADEHEGIVNGAMLYDRQQMAALFQLQIGNPGSSFAIEIARKIGLPDEVIADASEIVGSDYVNADKFLQDIVRDKRYWANKRQNIHQREKELEQTVANYRKELEELEDQRKEILAKAKEEAQQLLQEANARIENTIRTIKEAQAEKEKTREVRKQFNDFKLELELENEQEKEARLARTIERLKEKQNRKKERKEKRKQDALNTSVATTRSKPRQAPLQVGSTVRLKGQTTLGKIIELHHQEATVVFGNLKTSVNTDRLEAVAANANRQPELTTKSTFVSHQTQDAVYEKKLQFKQDIDVRGMRGDEAIQAVTYFIDDAILLNVGRVRILHGTGNGILRSLIRQYLSTVGGVEHYRDEHVQFGGAGITVVDLK